MLKSLAFIINPVSGIHRNAAKLEREIHASGKGRRYVIYTTRGHGDAGRFARLALEKGFDVIVAVGGDGTVNEVASALVGTEGCMGIIPRGSGNGFARALGLPLRIRDALQVAFDGEIVRADVGQAGHRYFCAVCGIGFDAAISEKFEFARVRGPAAYTALVLREWLRFQPRQCTLRFDGRETSEKRLFLATFANTNQFGNGAIIAPQARFDDGYLDLCLAGNVSRIHQLIVAHRLFRGTLDRDPDFHYHRVKQAEVRMPGPIRFHVDGEPDSIDADHLPIRIIPGALRVVIPRQAARSVAQKNGREEFTGIIPT